MAAVIRGCPHYGGWKSRKWNLQLIYYYYYLIYCVPSQWELAPFFSSSSASFCWQILWPLLWPQVAFYMSYYLGGMFWRYKGIFFDLGGVDIYHLPPPPRRPPWKEGFLYSSLGGPAWQINTLHYTIWKCFSTILLMGHAWKLEKCLFQYAIIAHWFFLLLMNLVQERPSSGGGATHHMLCATTYSKISGVCVFPFSKVYNVV